MKILLLLLSTLFAQANDLYTKADYAQAANLYEQCLTESNVETLHPSSVALIYYNLGNAYFKQGELSQSILAYERSLRLAPTMKDAQYNLAFAQSKIIDNITDTQTFFLKSWTLHIRNLLREPAWMWLSVACFLLTLIGALLFALSRSSGIKKTSFYTAVIALLVSIIGLCNAASLHNRDTLRAEAIITRGIVNAKASPDRSGTELFTLHEGTKVTIHETIGAWGEIHVGNNVGWVELATLERI